ncbi:DHA2 family efflux MFS transporter permease subunit [Streptomyces uncialis]|uniref:DHA2 family efflux MFS transporter permease subunit n=1 Tax=Streptomyces uncialis TaxID=1048205 RepID=UPI0038279BCE
MTRGTPEPPPEQTLVATTAKAPAADPDDSRLDPAFLRMAGVLLLALLLALLDETIVNVGVRTLSDEFGAPLPTVQWVTAGYLLAVAVATPFAGWAVDHFGGRTMWLVAVSVFVLGSLLSGLAWNIGSLIAFRVLQGLGGGMIVPVVQSVLATAAGPARVPKAMALISLPLTVGPVLGPVLGGVLVDAVDWRWMFLINVPLGAVILSLAYRTLPHGPHRGRPGPRLDVVGLLLLSPGFAALVHGFTSAAHSGDAGSARVLVSFAAGAVLLGAYAVHALRVSAPLIDLRMFANRGFGMAVVTMFLVGAVANALLFLTPLYYQQARGFGALDAGLLLIPSGVLGAVGAVTSGRTASRVTARFTSAAGMGVTALGALVFTRAGDATSPLVTAVALGLTGFGIGLTAPGTMAFMYRAVGEASAARATSALFIFNQIGGALGVAAVALLLQHGLDGAGGADGGVFGGVYWVVVGFAVVAAGAGAALPGGFRVGRPRSRP